MRETSLWKWLSRAHAMLDFTDELHWRRIENLVEEGGPDVEGCYKGQCFNIELKVSERPARPTTRVLGPSDIRPRQIPWAKARWKAGGATYFLIQVGSSATAKRYLLPGYRAGHIVGATEAELHGYSIITSGANQLEVLRNACSYRSPGLD